LLSPPSKGHNSPLENYAGKYLVSETCTLAQESTQRGKNGFLLPPPLHLPLRQGEELSHMRLASEQLPDTPLAKSGNLNILEMHNLLS
jgi:hypothetical protein